MSDAPLSFRPVTAETQADFEALFDAPGGPKYCWCMAFRATPEEVKTNRSAEGRGQIATIGHSFREAPAFHLTFAAVLLVSTAFVLIPGMPLLEVLYLSQALNAVLLLGVLPLMLRLGRDPDVMGAHATGRLGQVAGLVALAVIAVAVLALLVLQVTG